jgi:hypothetical protein
MRERGNALFLILIAVALFAALSYAITQSGRSGGGTTSQEQLALDASRLIAYSDQVRQAAMRLMLMGGCTDQQIEAYPSGGATPTLALHSSSYGGPPDGTSCDIFNSAGGGLTWNAGLGDLITRGLIPISGCYPACPMISGDNAATGVGTAAADLILYEPVYSLAFCNKVNSQLGLPAATSATTVDVRTRFHYGVYTALNTTPSPGTGATSACFTSASGWGSSTATTNLTPNPPYMYYSVLIER